MRAGGGGWACSEQVGKLAEVVGWGHLQHQQELTDVEVWAGTFVQPCVAREQEALTICLHPLYCDDFSNPSGSLKKNGHNLESAECLFCCHVVCCDHFISVFYSWR